LNEQFQEKAIKMMTVYIQSTASKICIYDCTYKPLPELLGEKSLENTVCKFCSGFKPGKEGKQEIWPCHRMHLNAIKEANRGGGSHIYQCDLGFMFWTSPVYTDGSFTAAIRGSGFLKTGDAIRSDEMCNGETTAETFRALLESFPKGDGEKIQSLAEMLLLCAESLSSGSEDYHELLRRRAEQQQAIAAIIEELKAKYAAAGNTQHGGALPGYPLEKERSLIAALRRGDHKTAAKTLNELLAVLFFANPGHFKYVQQRAAELVVLLSRVEVNPSQGGNLALETNSRSLKRVQEARSPEELTDILHATVERLADLIASFQGIPHASALRRAERYILENFTRKISLQEIAGVAGLSAPYFSTVFKEEMGENLSKYLNRLRVEKAGRMLLETNLPLSEIAGACCFEDQSWFSKIFKAYTGLSPGKYRNQGGGMVREISEDNLSEDFRKTVK
jgi:AraC-like DNA-binding protein